MHAITTTITGVIGRFGKTSKIYCDMRLSCSQLIQQGLEGRSVRNEVSDKPRMKYRRCARSEPTICQEKHRLTHTYPYFPKTRHSARKKDAISVEKKENISSGNEEPTPVNHYTINIYLNSCPNGEQTKKISSDFSVDKLTRNIASSSAIIEGFLKNRDVEKDKEYIEEKLGSFWKMVFESSRHDKDAKLGEIKSSFEQKLRDSLNANFDPTISGKTGKNLEVLSKGNNLHVPKKKPAINLGELPKFHGENSVGNEEFKKEPYFLDELKNEQIYVNKEFDITDSTENDLNNDRREERPKNIDPPIDIPATIPYYERGLYDSRTVKPRRIVSCSDHSRRRLPQDTAEVNKYIENLVRLSTQNQPNESKFTKLINYCKNFLTKSDMDKKLHSSPSLEEFSEVSDHDSKKPLSGSPERASTFLKDSRGNFHSPKRDYHQYNHVDLTIFSTPLKRTFSSQKTNKNKRERPRSVYINIEKSRHCLAGACTERQGEINPKNLQEERIEQNLAKKASKYKIFNPISTLKITNNNTNPICDKSKEIPMKTPLKTPKKLKMIKGPNSDYNHRKLLISKKVFTKIPRSKSETTLKRSKNAISCIRKSKSDHKIPYGHFENIPFSKTQVLRYNLENMGNLQSHRGENLKTNEDLMMIQNSSRDIKENGENEEHTIKNSVKNTNINAKILRKRKRKSTTELIPRRSSENTIKEYRGNSKNSSKTPNNTKECCTTDMKTRKFQSKIPQRITDTKSNKIESKTQGTFNIDSTKRKLSKHSSKSSWENSKSLEAPKSREIMLRSTRVYSTTFHKVSTKKNNAKSPDTRLGESNILKNPNKPVKSSQNHKEFNRTFIITPNQIPSSLELTKVVPMLKNISYSDSLMKTLFSDDPNYEGNPKFPHAKTSVSDQELKVNKNRHKSIYKINAAKPFIMRSKKSLGMLNRRTMSTSSDSCSTPCKNAAPTNDNSSKCKKTRKHTTKKPECLPTHKRLAKRNTKCPKEPLKYESLHARCDEEKSAAPKEDVMADVGGLFDECKQCQFAQYFGKGGYKNQEYHSYTKTSFYDINNHVKTLRGPQPDSGAKPK